MITHLIVATGLFLLLLLVSTLSSDRFLPQLGRQAANPFSILAIFVGLQFFDFSWLAIDDSPMLRTVPIEASSDQITQAALYYISMTLLFLSGAYIGMRSLTKQRVIEPGLVGQAERYSSGLTAALFIFLALVLQLATTGFSLDVATTSAQKGIRSQDLPLLPMAQWAAIIGGGLFLNCAKQSKASILLFGSILLVLSFITGARTLIFIVLMFMLTAAARIGVTFKRKWIFIAIVPVLALLTAFRFFFRATSWYGGTFTEFLGERGGPLGVLFSSDEISFSEVYTTALFGLQSGSVSRLPGESILGLIMTPFPRAWLGEWKPLPSQADFNLTLLPGWADWKGGIVVGPYFDLYFEYGLIGSFVMAIVYGAFVGFLAKLASNSDKVPYFWLGAVTSGLFIFMRTDMQNVGQFVWPVAIVSLTWKLITLTLRGRRRTQRFTDA